MEFEGNKLEMDCDRWTAEGKTRMIWSVGNGSPGNSVVTGDADSSPQNLRQPFKFGRGKVTRIDSTNLAETMSFVPRNIV